MVFCLGWFPNRRCASAQLVLNTVANILTIYLAYLLYFVLDDLCVVCVSLYFVNAANLVWSWKRMALFDNEADMLGGREKPKTTWIVFIWFEICLCIKMKSISMLNKNVWSKCEFWTENQFCKLVYMYMRFITGNEFMDLTRHMKNQNKKASCIQIMLFVERCKRSSYF